MIKKNSKVRFFKCNQFIYSRFVAFFYLDFPLKLIIWPEIRTQKTWAFILFAYNLHFLSFMVMWLVLWPLPFAVSLNACCRICSESLKVFNFLGHDLKGIICLMFSTQPGRKRTCWPKTCCRLSLCSTGLTHYKPLKGRLDWEYSQSRLKSVCKPEKKNNQTLTCSWCNWCKGYIFGLHGETFVS